MSTTFKTLAAQLQERVHASEPQLNHISSETWAKHPQPGKWAPIEILGHLIDSASNNHQRFVRLQYESEPTIVYAPDQWVDYQGYIDREPAQLISFWVLYNLHLAEVIKRMPETLSDNICIVGKGEKVTLKWLVEDYLVHLDHHLKQLIG